MPSDWNINIAGQYGQGPTGLTGPTGPSGGPSGPTGPTGPVVLAPIPGFLFGLTMTYNSGSLTGVAPGGCCSDDNTTTMVLTANFGKSTSSPWAAGLNAAGLDTGTVAASTWYHLFLIMNPTSRAVDLLYSKSATAPVMPSQYGFTLKRRIGSVKTDTNSLIIQFSQLGDKFLWRTPTEDYSNSTLPTAVTLITLNVPPGIQTEAQFNIYCSPPTAAVYLTIWAPDQSGAGNNIPSGNQTMQPWGVGAVLTMYMSTRTNTTQQVNLQASAAQTFYLTTTGWIDNRGK